MNLFSVQSLCGPWVVPDTLEYKVQSQHPKIDIAIKRITKTPIPYTFYTTFLLYNLMTLMIRTESHCSSEGYKGLVTEIYQCACIFLTCPTARSIPLCFLRSRNFTHMAACRCNRSNWPYSIACTHIHFTVLDLATLHTLTLLIYVMNT